MSFFPCVTAPGWVNSGDNVKPRTHSYVPSFIPPPPFWTTCTPFLAPAMAATNDLILSRLQSPIGTIEDVARHLINAGGKRIRPLLTLGCAALFAPDDTRFHKLATAVEFIHSATLLHDDVVDGSETRRNQQVANIVYGNKPAILVGDFLFARAFELMVETENLRVLDLLSRAP